VNATLKALWNLDTPGIINITEGYHISYHRPSQMFNVTQMHRFATLNRLHVGLSDPRIRCDNFVEVRGEPNLEGNFVPLSMLPLFADAFGLTVIQQPEARQDAFKYDPSDFSRNSERVVLAHEHLVAYVSVSRYQDQVTHCPKDVSDFRSMGGFLSTYFGNWIVLPKNPNGMHEYQRLYHWARYRTAEEMQAGADISQRKVLKPQSIHSKSGSLKPSGSTQSFGSSRTLPALMDRDPETPCHLLMPFEIESKPLPRPAPPSNAQQKKKIQTAALHSFLDALRTKGSPRVRHWTLPREVPMSCASHAAISTTPINLFTACSTPQACGWETK
jgi:hypothetical protein